MLAHGGASFIRIDTQRPKFPVEGRPLHTHEFGRSGDVPAKSVDLGEQILPLEDLPGVAQRQRHQMLAPCPIRRQGHRRDDLVGQHVRGHDRVRVANLGKLYGLARHDGREGVFVHQLLMAITAQEDAKIVKPSHNALKFNAIHEEYGQRCLVLANMVEKRVLQALRAFCRHGLPRPFGPRLRLLSAPGAPGTVVTH